MSSIRDLQNPIYKFLCTLLEFENLAFQKGVHIYCAYKFAAFPSGIRISTCSVPNIDDFKKGVITLKKSLDTTM